MELFPFMQPQLLEKEELTVPREIKWDFIADVPVFKNKKPVFVLENEAIKVWIWNALKTARKRFVIFTHNYGNDFEELIGQTYSESIKQMEAKRYLEECLLINPYIQSVDNIQVDFKNDSLTISFSVTTKYGKIEMAGDEFV